MRSPLPLLVAALGCLAVGVILSLQPERPDRPGSGRVEDPLSDPPVLSPARPLSPTETIAIGGFKRLFTHTVGETVVLPVGGGLAGKVNLRQDLPTGERVLGLDLGKNLGATAFLSLGPAGTIEGHLISRRLGSALVFSTDPGGGSVEVKPLRADDLVCARFEAGGLIPGMPPEPLAGEGDLGEMSGPEESIPALRSRPGSTRVVYLDFDGETISGTPWNSSYNEGEPIVAAAFATPAHIEGIWETIAEDYAVFDVNVTTVRADFDEADPGSRVMTIFTPTKAWYGSAGGVAYVNSFGSTINPYCWVFNQTLNGAAESGSHEIGHTVGLRHDGTSSRAYYTGHTHASGVSWAPIMGTGYGRTIVQFSKGEYAGANRLEDDLAIISGKLPYLPDDHGDSSATATLIPPSSTIEASGRISSPNDEDLFRIDCAEAGSIVVTATPHPRYRNLDVGIVLLDGQSQVLATAAPAGPFEASLSVPVTAGTYYLRLYGTGLGDLVTGYGTYGSIGSYTLTGTYPANPLPPGPTGLTATDGSSTTAVSLTWDAVPGVDGYRLYRGLTENSDDADLIASPATTSHDDVTAEPGTDYWYFVSARVATLESPRSAGEPGWRQRLPPDAPASVTASDDSPHSIRVSWTAADRAQSYRISRNPVNAFIGAVEIATTTSLSWHDTTTAVNDPHYYFVEALNTGGTSAPTGSAVPGVKIPLPPGTPTGLSASDGSSSSVTLLTWSAVPGATGYRVFRNTTDLTAGAVEIALVGETTSHADAGGAAGTVFWYFIRAIVAGNDSGPSNLDSGFRLAVAPAAPTGISATPGTAPDGVRVNWEATPDTTQYRIYRSEGTSTDAAELIGETTLTEWIDLTALPGRTYRYFVRGENAVGLSVFSDPALGYGSATDPLDDEYENNDDLSLATALGGNTIHAVAVDGDPDWYGVTLAPGETRLDLAVITADVDGRIVLSLHDESGALVAPSSESHGARVISHLGAAGASYRLLVERDEGAAVGYELILRPLAPDAAGLVPDAVIGTAFPPRLGEGFITPSASGQILFQKWRSGSTRLAYLDLVNRSAVSGTFLARSAGGTRRIELEHYRLLSGRWQRITAAMKRSGSIATLDPFARASFLTIARRQDRATARRSSLAVPYVFYPAIDPATREEARWILTLPPQRR